MPFDRGFDPSKVSGFWSDLMVFDTNSSDFGEKMHRCREYMEALESERRKIQVFERELPLCLDLVTQAIEGCRQQISGTRTDYFNGQSECSEQTSSEGPVLEEFIPMKRTSSVDEDDQEHLHQQLNHKPKTISTKDKSSSTKKSDWLRSAQLSIQTPDPVDLSPKRVQVVEVKRNGCGAFHPFKKEKSSEAALTAGNTKSATPATDPTATVSSTAETGSGGGGGCDGSKIEDKGQSNRKARRCWSPELHRRFLHALQQLGGAHVATPKQIRELMKVDGLTNDEVKSHLQKYRLHTRRPSPTMKNNNGQETPQFVVVGGIWMPPPEYTTMAANSTPNSGDTNNSKGVYAPIVSHPASMADVSMSLNNGNSDDKDGGHSHGNSPSTSSSTHTTTASPVF